MKIQILTPTSWIPEMLRMIERVARISHGSKMSTSMDETKEFLRKLLRWGHWTPFEVGFVTVLLQDVSRGLSHELVRHRLASPLQSSTRYREPEYCWTLIPDEARPELERLFDQAKEVIRRYTDDPDIIRQVYPIASKVELAITANFREWHHIFALRCDKAAHPEIRQAMLTLLRTLKELASPVFDDFLIYDDHAELSGEYKIV